MKKFICIFITMFIVTGIAFAEDKKTNPLKLFLAETYVKYFTCKLEAQAGLMQGKTLEESLSCINQYKDEEKKSYKEAKKYLSNNKSAISMLKDYYAYWIASMDSIVPQGEETITAYENRLEFKLGKLNELSERLKLEVE